MSGDAIGDDMSDNILVLRVERRIDRGAGRNDIQCVVGHGRIPFGHAQRPAPWDYPDGRDVIAFISQAAR